MSEEVKEKEDLKIVVKEVTAGFKGSYDYQSFPCLFTMVVGKDVDPKVVAEKLMTMGMEVAAKKIAEYKEANPDDGKPTVAKAAAKKTFKPGEVQPKPFNCSECDAAITERANEFSFKNYKKALCFKCQGIEKAKEEEDKK